MRIDVYQNYILKGFFLFLTLVALFYFISEVCITDKSVEVYKDNSIEIEVGNLVRVEEASYHNYFNSSFKTIYQDKVTGIYYLDCHFEQSSFPKLPECCEPTPIKSNIATVLLINKKELSKTGTIDDPIMFLDNYPFHYQSNVQKCYNLYRFQVKQHLRLSILGNWYLPKQVYNIILYIVGLIMVLIIIVSARAILSNDL